MPVDGSDSIDNRGGGGIGNACIEYNYDDVTANARHGTLPCEVQVGSLTVCVLLEYPNEKR